MNAVALDVLCGHRRRRRRRGGLRLRGFGGGGDDVFLQKSVELGCIVRANGRARRKDRECAAQGDAGEEVSRRAHSNTLASLSRSARRSTCCRRAWVR